MSDHQQKIEDMMQELILARGNAAVQLKKIHSQLESGEILSEGVHEAVNKSLASVFQLQNDIFSVIPSKYGKPSTLNELRDIADDIERTSHLL
ncbi:hypothetical protein EN829_056240, partial [Mesorhizobium sp. M00.F.Ca.ET.186.01.1.1]